MEVILLEICDQARMLIDYRSVQDNFLSYRIVFVTSRAACGSVLGWDVAGIPGHIRRICPWNRSFRLGIGLRQRLAGLIFQRNARSVYKDVIGAFAMHAIRGGNLRRLGAR